MTFPMPSVSFKWLRQVLISELLSKIILVIHMFKEKFQTIHVPEIIAIVLEAGNFCLQKKRKDTSF